MYPFPSISDKVHLEIFLDCIFVAFRITPLKEGEQLVLPKYSLSLQSRTVLTITFKSKSYFSIAFLSARMKLTCHIVEPRNITKFIKIPVYECTTKFICIALLYNIFLYNDGAFFQQTSIKRMSFICHLHVNKIGFV